MTGRLLLLEDAAEQYGFPIETLRDWRKKGYGPPSAKLGRRVFYREADFDAWIDAEFRAQAPTAGEHLRAV